jgi:spore germination cell wall hydrolase CwlJ-like protein
MLILQLLFAVNFFCNPVEYQIVIQTIAYESSNQSFEGQVAVANTILTRAEMSGTTIFDVVTKPKQFSCWIEKQERKLTPKELLLAEKALLYASRNRQNITHYHTRSIRPKWSKKLHRVLILDDHIFYFDENFK